MAGLWLGCVAFQDRLHHQAKPTPHPALLPPEAGISGPSWRRERNQSLDEEEQVTYGREAKRSPARSIILSWWHYNSVGSWNKLVGERVLSILGYNQYPEELTEN